MQFFKMIFVFASMWCLTAPAWAQNCEAPEQTPAILCGSDSCYANHIGEVCWTWYEDLNPSGQCWTKFSTCLGNTTVVIRSYYGSPTSTSECVRRANKIQPCPAGGCPDPPAEHEPPCTGEFCGAVTLGAVKDAPVFKVAEGVGLLRGTALFMVSDWSAIVTPRYEDAALVPLVESDWIARRLARQYNGRTINAGEAQTKEAIAFFRTVPGALGVIERHGAPLGLAAQELHHAGFRDTGDYLAMFPDPWVMGRLVGQPASSRDLPVTIRPVVIYVWNGRWTSHPDDVASALADVFLPE